MIVFFPRTQNSNLIKELIWWTGTILLMGIWLLGTSSHDVSHISKRVRWLYGSWRWLLFLGFLWFLWNIFELFNAIDKNRAVIFFLRQTGYLLMAAIVAVLFSTIHSVIFLARFLSIIFAIMSLYTLFQFIGIDFIKWKDLSRPLGTFGNPNFTANLLSSLLPLVFVWEVYLRKTYRRRSSNFDPRDVFPERMGFPYISFLGLLAVFATQSRGGLVGLGAGMIVLVWFLWLALRHEGNHNHQTIKIRKRALLRRLLVIILFIEMACALVYWLAPDRLVHVFSSSTIQVRLQLWKGSLILWQERIFTGHGLGSFAVISPRVKYLVEPITYDKKAHHAHSWFFELLVDHGLIGTVLFLIIFGYLLARFVLAVITIPHRDQRLFLVGISAGIISLLASTFFCVWLNWWDGGWILWFLAGLGLAVSMMESTIPDKKAPSTTSYPKTILFFFKIVGVVLLLSSFLFGILGVNFLRSETYLLSGQRLVEQRRYTDALVTLSRAENCIPHSPDIHYWKALCLWNLGRVQESADILKNLVDTRPWDSRSFQLLGQGYRSLGLLEYAEIAYRASYKIEPSGRIAEELSKILFARNKNIEAREVLEGQLARGVYPPALQLYLKSQRESGNTVRAREYIRDLRDKAASRQRRKSLGELARWDAELSMILDDPVGAVAAYRDALAITPESFELWNDYALAKKALGRLNHADKAFERAAYLNPQHYAPIINRLELALERKDTMLARELIERLDTVATPQNVKQRTAEIKSVIERLEKRPKLREGP